MITKRILFLLFLPIYLPISAREVAKTPGTVKAVDPAYPTDKMLPSTDDFGPFDRTMSEEEMMNQLVEMVNAAIPEDEQNKFWDEVAQQTLEIEERTAHMSPEKKDEFLLGVMKGEIHLDDLDTPEIEEEQVVKEVVQTVKPKSKVPVEKKEEIMIVVSQVAKSIESFLAKAEAFPDFDGKVLRWVEKKDRITDWQTDSWASFQHELNKFVHTLHRFKEKDAKIGFKHLDALLKQEATIQNLKQLQKKLADYETKIPEFSTFEIAKMSEPTKNAAINTINSLTESLYRTKLPQELQKIIEEFDPIAKKLREEDEKAAKEALTRSKRFEPTMPIRTAGQPPRRDDFALPSLDDFGLTGERRPRIANGGKTQSGRPSDTKKDKLGKGTKGGPGGDAKDAADKGKKDGDKKGKAPGDKRKKEEEAKKKKDEGQIKHTGIKDNVAEFRKDVREASNAIFETPEFGSNEELKKYLQ